MGYEAQPVQCSTCQQKEIGQLIVAFTKDKENLVSKTIKTNSWLGIT